MARHGKSRKAPREAAQTAASVPIGSQPLRSFEVFGLFGRHNLALRLAENRLVLVGENGTGKSTLVNILYYCLTGQWTRLVEMPFTKLKASFETTTIEIERDRLRRELLARPGEINMVQYLRRRVGPVQAERIHRELMLTSERVRYGIGPEQASLFPHEHALEAELWRELMMRSATQTESTYIPDLDAALKRVVTEQVLFLPTYRRIERDLQAIFPQMRPERDLRAFHRSTPTDAAYVELVEFGMRDVADVISATMQALDRDFRQDLVRLTSLYLRDVIRGDYNHGQFEALLSEATAEAIPALLTRVDEEILPRADRNSLSELIRTIQQTGTVPPESRVAAHFLVRLVEAHALQSKREAPVREFTQVCNGYLSGKQLVFDSAQFELFVCRTEDDARPILEQRISVDGLSSGEKQIVSLFAHMYLSGKSRYYVIIDEPELSISVIWQRKFLEDIINTGMCSGMVAVTHSPFIFENSLATSAHSITEFMVQG